MCDKRNLCCFLYIGYFYSKLCSLLFKIHLHIRFVHISSNVSTVYLDILVLQLNFFEFLLFNIHLHIRFVHISSYVSSVHLDFLVLQLNFFKWFFSSFWLPVFAVIILLFNRNLLPWYCLQSKSWQKMCHLLFCCLSSLLVILQKVCFNIWVVIAMVLHSSKLQYLQILIVKSKMTASTICYLLFFVA